jgi:hypothetical protein
MKSKRILLVTLLLIGLLATSTALGVQGPASPLGIVPTPTPQPLTVNVWTDKSTYTVGETMRVFFDVNQPAYIYVYDIQPDGVVRLVFPNAYSQSNFVSAGNHVLPDSPSYHFTVHEPTGVEKVQIIASINPLTLSPSSFGEPFPMATPETIQGQIMGIAPEPCEPSWATAWTSFTIVAPPSSSCPSCYKPSPPCYKPSTPCYKPCTPCFPFFPFFGRCFSGSSCCSSTIRFRFGMRFDCDP